MTLKDLIDVKTNGVNALHYIIINKINGYIEKSNEMYKYLMIVPTEESKDTLKKYGELWT